MNNKESRGQKWLAVLSGTEKRLDAPVNSIEIAENNGIVYISVVPDPQNHYPRARNGEVGLLEGWSLGRFINKLISEDKDKKEKRAILAIVDVASQAYGRREEAFGLHQSLACSVAAYASARENGHPVIALIVGKAMSGAFLAHGYQANMIYALNDEKVVSHAMGKEAAARITLRTVKDLDRLASTIPPMAYDIKNYASLGLLEKLLDVSSADNPTQQDVEKVRNEITLAINKCKKSSTHLLNRLGSPNRQATSLVRERMRAVW